MNFRKLLVPVVIASVALNLFIGSNISLAASAAPTGTYLQEDFGSGTTQTWTYYNNKPYTVSNGKLNLQSGTAIAAISSMTFSDFVLNSDVYVNSNNDGGIIFRSNNPANEDGYYVGLYAATNEVRLYKLASSSPFIASASNVTIDPGVKCKVRIVAKGSNIKVYVNSMEIPVIDVNDTTYTSGYVGVRSFCTSASYDNFNVLAPKYIKNVYTVNFNPLLESISQIKGYNYYLQDYVGTGITPKEMKEIYVDDIQKASHNTVYYNVVGWEDWDEYPKYTCGAQYDDASYIDALSDSANKMCAGFHFDYNHYFVDDSTSNVTKKDFVSKIKNLINTGKVDEVYIFADGTDMGLNESKMIGNNPYWCNSGGLTATSYNKNFVAMFFNYNRLDNCMLESFGHRAEDIMSQIYNNTYPWRTCMYIPDSSPHGQGLTYAQLNNWEKFTLTQRHKSSDSTAVIGCGDIHHAPSSNTQSIEYEPSWGCTTIVNSNYKYWMQYPGTNLSITNTDPSNNITWGSDQKSHHMWWLGCLPHLTNGNASDGKLADWWSYIVNP